MNSLSPFFPFPDEIAIGVLSFLKISDLTNVRRVNKQGKLLAGEIIPQKIKIKYWFQGKNDFNEAKQYVEKLKGLIWELFQANISKNDLFVFHSSKNYASTRTIHLKKTFENLTALPPSEIIKLFYSYPPITDGYYRNYGEGLVFQYDNPDLYLCAKRLLKNASGVSGEQTSGIKQANYIVLKEAVTRADKQLVKIRLNKKPSLDAHELLPLLCLACELGFLDIVKLLVSKGAKVNCRCPEDYSTTPLHIAIKYKHPGVAKFLLQNGANPNVINNNGNSPLHIAALCSEKTFVKLLYENNVKMDVRKPLSGATPLFIAAEAGLNRPVKFL